MEAIKDLITAYLPTISSIAAIIVSVVTFLSRVKTIVGDSIKENDNLKGLLNNLERETAAYKKKIADGNDEVIKTIKLLREELEKTKEQLKTANEALHIQQQELDCIVEIKEEYIKCKDEIDLCRRKLNTIERK